MATMGARMAPHVAAFARILNASQTQELHQWTLASLERAFAWAKAMESLASKAEKDGDAALEVALAEYLPRAALPAMAHRQQISVAHTLRNATRFVCDAVLTSAWLSTHSARAELSAYVLKTRLQSAASRDSTSGGDADSLLSEMIMDQMRTQRSLQAAHKMSSVLECGMKRKRVLVRSAAFDVAPLVSYTLQRRTQRLQSLARTLQANVCAASALARVETTAYEDLLVGIDHQLKQAQQDVVEVIAWSVVLDWSCPPDVAVVVRGDVVQRIDRWTESQPMKTLLRILAPWLAAKLACVSAVFARHYVTGLLGAGLHSMDTPELRYRIGTLVLQDASELRTRVDTQLDALDPLTREQLLASLSI